MTENTQSLPDGNRIRNSNTTSYARDGEGRTRREVTIGGIGPFSGGATHKTIFIHDPIGRVDYILDPQNKTVRKVILPANGNFKVAADSAGKGNGVVAFARRAEAPRERVDVMVERGPTSPVVMERFPAPPGLMTAQGEGGVAFTRSTAIAGVAVAGSPNSNMKTESLGKRIIEGVEAEGTRSVTTIAAGEIGNERPIEIVDETWYSKELEALVYSRHADPRTGETSYRLTNIRRGEQPMDLFEVPVDYKVHEGPGKVEMKIRTRKPE